jgi:phospholipid/cholesterol/gamma-HCH transport system ATP-binding protein
MKVFAKETLVIIGRSGSGKSVTIRHMVGLEKPDSGKITVFGRELARVRTRELRRIRLRMGYLFQSGALLNWMTVGENVELPLIEHRRDMAAGERRERVLAKLRLVEMEEAAHKYPSEISGGMKKRAALARAIILDPEVILYDEPTTGLDPVIANTINDLIVHTGEALGSTQVVVTHDMESAYRIGDRIAMLYEGRIIALGTPEEIQGSKDPIVSQFVEGRTEGPITETPSRRR